MQFARLLVGIVRQLPDITVAIGPPDLAVDVPRQKWLLKFVELGLAVAIQIAPDEFAVHRLHNPVVVILLERAIIDAAAWNGRFSQRWIETKNGQVSTRLI